MTKLKAGYRCHECDSESFQWLGRCPACRAWDSLVETPDATISASAPPVVAMTSVPASEARPCPTGVGEFDRVLGGGLVPGSVTLMGGEPGAGKSTLALQALHGLARGGGGCLLVSAEESEAQVRARAARLGALHDRVTVLAETSLAAVRAAIDAVEPEVVAVDSIQTIADPEQSAMAGTVTQVRACAQALVALAKTRDIATLLLGHVTKEGDLAGPRVLEHVVDTVVAFEGDRHQSLRMLRVLKHRFGSTHELGLLEMTPGGLVGVPDPSGLFLADRRPGLPGSVVAAVVEHGRPLLVEVQALVAPTEAPVKRRSAQGIDSGRLAMLLGVLERRGRLPLGGADVYTSVAGGLRVAEPGVDLPVVLALASSSLERHIESETVVVGEVGLGGEVRQVSQVSRRLSEAVRLGFSRAIVPLATPPIAGLEMCRVGEIHEAVAAATDR